MLGSCHAQAPGITRNGSRTLGRLPDGEVAIRTSLRRSVTPSLRATTAHGEYGSEARQKQHTEARATCASLAAAARFFPAHTAAVARFAASETSGALGVVGAVGDAALIVV